MFEAEGVYLVNLNPSPQPGEPCFWKVAPGLTIRVHADPAESPREFDIVLPCVPAAPFHTIVLSPHCLLRYDFDGDNRRVVIAPASAQALTYINGTLLTREDTEIFHGDNITFGNRYALRLTVVGSRTTVPKSLADWDSAMVQLAEKTGRLVASTKVAELQQDCERLQRELTAMDDKFPLIVWSSFSEGLGAAKCFWRLDIRSKDYWTIAALGDISPRGMRTGKATIRWRSEDLQFSVTQGSNEILLVNGSTFTVGEFQFRFYDEKCTHRRQAIAKKIPSRTVPRIITDLTTKGVSDVREAINELRHAIIMLVMIDNDKPPPSGLGSAGLFQDSFGADAIADCLRELTFSVREIGHLFAQNQSLARVASKATQTADAELEKNISTTLIRMITQSGLVAQHVCSLLKELGHLPPHHITHRLQLELQCVKASSSHKSDDNQRRMSVGGCLVCALLLLQSSSFPSDFEPSVLELLRIDLSSLPVSAHSASRIRSSTPTLSRTPRTARR